MWTLPRAFLLFLEAAVVQAGAVQADAELGDVVCLGNGLQDVAEVCGLGPPRRARSPALPACTSTRIGVAGRAMPVPGPSITITPSASPSSGREDTSPSEKAAFFPGSVA